MSILSNCGILLTMQIYNMYVNTSKIHVFMSHLLYMYNPLKVGISAKINEGYFFIQQFRQF